MLSSVTWSQYATVMLVATILYYLFVWLVYYKGRIPFLPGMGHFKSPSFHGEDYPDEMLSTVQHIIDEIKPVFNNRNNKSELIMALQLKLRRYNQWDEPGFRETINEFIASESQSKCSIRLGEEDQRAVWL